MKAIDPQAASFHILILATAAPLHPHLLTDTASISTNFLPVTSLRLLILPIVVAFDLPQPHSAVGEVLLPLGADRYSEGTTVALHISLEPRQIEAGTTVPSQLPSDSQLVAVGATLNPL